MRTPPRHKRDDYLIEYDSENDTRHQIKKITNMVRDNFEIKTYSRYHIHDFANQSLNRELTNYINDVCTDSDTFHIIVINQIDFGKYTGLVRLNLSKSNTFTDYYTSNIIVTLVNSGIEQDDIVCLRLLDKFGNKLIFPEILNNGIVVKILTDDNMTKPQHESAISIAHRYFNTFYHNTRAYTGDEDLKSFLKYVKTHCVGIRGIITSDGAIPTTPENLERRKRKFGLLPPTPTTIPTTSALLTPPTPPALPAPPAPPAQPEPEEGMTPHLMTLLDYSSKKRRMSDPEDGEEDDEEYNNGLHGGGHFKSRYIEYKKNYLILKQSILNKV